MRIILVNDHEHGGGAEVHVKAQSELLKSAGHQVRFVHERPRLIHLVSRFFNPFLLHRLVTEMRSFRPDVVHVHKSNLAFSFTPFLAAHLLRIPSLSTLQDFGIFCPDGWGLTESDHPCTTRLRPSCIFRSCARSRRSLRGQAMRLYNTPRNLVQVRAMSRWVARVLCPSHALAAWARPHFGNRVHVFPMFVESGPCPLPRTPPTDPTLLYLGRVVEEKGLQIIVQAMPNVDGVRLEIAGDGPYRPVLERMIHDLGLQNRIRWLGRLGRKEIVDALEVTDALVLPSLWIENTPVAALEAMERGIPVLASHIGGFPDLIVEGVNGMLVEHASVSAWSQALQVVSKEPSLLRTMGTRARERALALHSPDLHLRTLLEHYHAAMNRPSCDLSCAP